MTNVRNHPMAALTVLVLAMFMTLLDLTIVNIAIPSILDGLHATLDQVLWVLNAYSLLYAVLLITSARLGDIYGPRNLLAAGIAIFTAASVLSGFAQDANQLIAARALQGTLGGLLVTHFGWRWIFFVNLPIGLLTFALALLLVPDLRSGVRHRLDLFGVALATFGLLGVIFGLIEGQRYDWGAVYGAITIPGIIGAGLAFLVLFLIYQARHQRGEPLLPFAIFKDRNFMLMSLVMAALGFAMLGVYLPLTIYLQSVLGLSAIDAGITIAAQPLAMMFSSGVAAALV
ncbi:MAG: MFS transporter, partial [Chloroflexi bacterium]